MADTLINGNRPSFVNLSVTFAGLEQPRGVFLSLDYSSKQEPGEIYSKSTAQLVGTTPGYAKCSGSFEMLVSEFNDFLNDLTNKGAIQASLVVFDITISYSSNSIDTQTDKLVGCRMLGVDSANRGTGATTKSVQFIYNQLVVNGVVIAGDNSLAQGDTFATPVASDFWAPTYEDQDGDWFSPGFIGNTYMKSAWDSVFISVPFSGSEQPMTPGLAEVKFTKYRDVDKNKKAAGTDGKRVTIHGIEPAEGEIELTIWTPQQYRMLIGLWPLLFPGPQKFTTTKTVQVPPDNSAHIEVGGKSYSVAKDGRLEATGTVDSSGNVNFTSTRVIPQQAQTKRVSTTQVKSIIRPFDVRHPTFTQYDVRSIVFVKGSAPQPGPAPFSRVYTLGWVEFMPPGKVNATTSPAASKASTLEPLGYQTPGANPQNGNLV